MNDLALFSDIVMFDIKTEGIKYVGSKAKLLPQILELSHKVGARDILDGFSGSTRVSQAYAKNGFRVTSNDHAVWSRIFAECYLAREHRLNLYDELIAHLNALPPKKGWFTKHYGGCENNGNAIQKDGQKRPWQIKNTMKLDAIRDEIDNLDLDSTAKAVALTSLIIALDKVDSTLGHYVSYLRDWSPRSYNDLILKTPSVFSNDLDHRIIEKDIFDVIKQDKYDLAYFDPPYGSNNEKMPPSRVRYRSYYHVWETICLNDKPIVFGKSNRRLDTSDKEVTSVFEEFRKSDKGRFVAIEAIERLIQDTQANFILLSYSSGGRATSQELIGVLQKAGKLIEVVEMDYKKNVMANMHWSKEWIRDIEMPHKEFLFLLEKF